MIRRLDSLTRHDAATYGGKAAQLGELAAAGLLVPPGFVVGPEALEIFLASIPGLDGWLATPRPPAQVAQAMAEQCEARPLPPALEAEIHAAYAALAAELGTEKPAVAVRSSARGEDSEAASFAGQQATFLHVLGPHLVSACIRACWAGLWSERASAYRDRLGDHARPTMAVLVQALVVPEVAGVAFTVNPVTGARDELVLDASWGLGEAVVSGRATPDHVRVAKADGRVLAYDLGSKQLEVVPDGVRGVAERLVEPARAAARALDEPAIAQLLALALRAEAHFGAPQDVEWGLAGGRAYMLQSRPITSLPPPPPPGGWVSPEPGVVWERRNFAEHLPGPISTLAATLLLPAVGVRVAELGRAIGYDLATPAFTTLHGYAYARATMAERRDQAWCTAMLYGRMFTRPAAAWQLAGPYQQRLAPYLDAPPPAEPARIVAWCEGVVGEFALAWADLHRLSGGWRWTEYAVLWLLRQASSDRLLQGFDSPALDFERRVHTLLAMARSAPMLAEALAAGRPDEGGPAFAEAVAAAHESALRFPASFDPADPLPFEGLPMFCQHLAGRLDHAGQDPTERLAAQLQDREAATREALARVGPWKRPLLRLLLNRARAFAAIREPALAELALGWPQLRAQLVRLGALLGLGERVFDCTWDELKAGRPPAADVLAERAAARVQASDYQPPLIIGGAPSRSGGRTIAGTPASPGRVTGIARVITGPADFDQLGPGEILVAPATTPAWTPLFHRALAVVTDVGGPLSHGSIVAREFRIPAVLGTESATRRVKSGDVITVDGDLGVVWRGG
ncbi:MAG: phosphoenolpyruvate synthase [Cyanobacteria bacterium RYN_339]|nr:phosphoenolpyruvate synthase [Cyanobacteria bacterium RYN_339]